jgi:hypothetical protein
MHQIQIKVGINEIAEPLREQIYVFKIIPKIIIFGREG